MGRLTWIAGLVLCAGLTDRQTAAAQPAYPRDGHGPGRGAPLTLFNGRRMSPPASFTSQVSPWSGLTPRHVRLAVSRSASSRSLSARRAAIRTCSVLRPARQRREG